MYGCVYVFQVRIMYRTLSFFIGYAGLGCCMGFSLAAMGRLLIAVVSLAEHRL